MISRLIRISTKTILILIITALVCEVALAFYVRMTAGEFIFAANLNKEYVKRIYSIENTHDCVWGDTVELHPYIGYMYSNTTGCVAGNRNNYGFRGRDLQLTYDPNFYSIMILGASVAEQLGTRPGKDSITDLELILNQRFISPTGKPFRILNFSIAGSHQPVAYIAAGLFIDKVDQIVSVEGFNEAGHILEGISLYTPSGAWLELSEAQRSPVHYKALKFGYFFVKLINSGPLKNSYTLHFVLKAATENLVDKFRKRVYQNHPFHALYSPLSFEQRVNASFTEYLHYTENLKALANHHKKPLSIFLQPYPQKYKALTAEEKAHVQSVSIDGEKISKLYTQFRERSKTDIVSLEKVFEDTKETIYVDFIHFNRTGVQIVAGAIADHIGQSGKWKRR